MNWKDLSKTFKVSFLTGLAFMAIGFGFVLLDLSALGIAFFCFLPIAIGIASGMLPDRKQAIWGVGASLVVFSIILLATEAEGVVCLVMAAPILLLAIIIGTLIGNYIRRKKGDQSLKVTLLPFLVFVIANFFEVFSGNQMMPSSVSTTVELAATKSEVYDAIIAVDTVDVATNFLHKVGLPTPRKCILSEAKVGGHRFCEFEQGHILETIVELRQDEYLRMDVTECKLEKNRSWLKFDEDIYTIKKKENGKTAITRTTTYFSTLKPRFYWEFMEAITINSEHDFVFRNLKKDVEGIE